MLYRDYKEEYQFYLSPSDSTVVSWEGFKDLYAAGHVSEEDFLARKAYYTSWLDGHEVAERAWARNEISMTDFMLLPDATYKGEPLAGSEKLADIMQYRKAVREYDLRESPRPPRPSWYEPENPSPTPLAIGGKTLP